MAKTKNKEQEKIVETVNILPHQEPTEKTVIGIVEAEKLQKSGWQLISVTQESENPYGVKTYKFVKEKEK